MLQCLGFREGWGIGWLIGLKVIGIFQQTGAQKVRGNGKEGDVRLKRVTVGRGRWVQTMVEGK